MSELTHDASLLGAYTLGVLDAEEAHAVEEHVAGCADCRRELAELAEIREMLGEVPPEAFLDGPPEGGDLMLQRTLRQVRASAVAEPTVAGPPAPPARRWQRMTVAAASVVAIAVAALGSGFVLGRTSAPGGQALPTPVSASPTTGGPSVPGTRRVSGTDPASGASLAALITPAAGWVRVHADVGGIRAGERCLLIVRSRDGARVIAGSWLVSPKGEKDGTPLDGSALVAPADVASIDVETFDGRKLISVPA